MKQSECIKINSLMWQKPCQWNNKMLWQIILGNWSHVNETIKWYQIYFSLSEISFTHINDSQCRRVRGRLSL